MCSTKVLFLIVNVNEFNTYDVQAISTCYSIEIIKFAFVWNDITDVENLQDVIILTVSNFVKSRSSVQTLLANLPYLNVRLVGNVHISVIMSVIWDCRCINIFTGHGNCNCYTLL